MASLALGGDLKGAFAIEDASGEIRHFTGFGDLADAEHHAAWLNAIRGECRSRRIEAVAVDLHPRYLSRLAGEELTREFGARLVEVQHHQAHAETALALARVEGPALALVMDGTGYGTDGTIWGCELLLLPRDGTAGRLGHLRTVPCPGADAAVREPWRMAIGWLGESLAATPAGARLRDTVGAVAFDAVMKLADSPATPRTSSAGRAFDAAAAILGLVTTAASDAEAPLKLEEAAAAHSMAGELLPYAVRDGVLDLAPAFAALAQSAEPARTNELAAAFHRTVVAGLTELVSACRRPGLRSIALAGGCFLNRFLRDELPVRLAELGLEPRLPPPEFVHDAALPLGQLQVARQVLRKVVR